MKSFLTKYISIWTTAQELKTSNRGRSASNQSLLGIKKLHELILELAVRGKLVKAPSRARKIVKLGTVIYSTVRPYLKNICVIDQEYSPEPIASTAFAILHPYLKMPGRFFLFYLQSPVFVRYVESEQIGIAYPAINDKQFFSGVIPCSSAFRTAPHRCQG